MRMYAYAMRKYARVCLCYIFVGGIIPSALKSFEAKEGALKLHEEG